MKCPLFHRCAHAPGVLSPEDQAIADQFRATLTALLHPMSWTPGGAQDIAVRIPVTAMRHPAAAVTAAGIPNPDEDGTPATWAT
ncbi:hypothetical protein [Streptomyces sp. NPDC048106]|uniref:hypothetical protein n=1 Tax=Streptomyces sp. NPDC048106 TaxID=3155750 RepID=UPI00345602A0